MADQLKAREFRNSWTRLTDEVVAVTSNGREIGFWVPIGTEEWKWIADEKKASNSKAASASNTPASISELDDSPPI